MFNNPDAWFIIFGDRAKYMTKGPSNLPVVAITMGDAAGIGPEITIKALAAGEFAEKCRCVIVGDRSCLLRVATELGIDIELPAFDVGATGQNVSVLDLKNLPDEFTIGVDAAVTGKASAEYIEAAVGLWRENKVDAICTAPISKKALALGGYNYPGHTEFLAELTATTKFAMSFFGGDLRVVLLSTHLSLRNALDLVKKEPLIDLIRFSSTEFAKLLKRPVSLAVAGLNPHASEDGMFGGEENDEIAPAIEYCRETEGINVHGPFSPDTVFVRASRGEFDAVVALYHDQATIPVKALAFGSAVNVTLGLPLIRTSVDHGTAFDIAGRSVADPSSMKAAIALAADLAFRSQRSAHI